METVFPSQDTVPITEAKLYSAASRIYFSPSNLTGVSDSINSAGVKSKETSTALI